VFRQIVEDSLKLDPRDDESARSLTTAQSYCYLPLDQTNEPLRSEILQRLALVAEKTLQGDIPGWREADIEGQRMYRDALQELLLPIKQ
jgi:hypothetical protein